MYIGSCIDDKANIACFAVFAKRKTARSRAADGAFRKSPAKTSSPRTETVILPLRAKKTNRILPG